MLYLATIAAILSLLVLLVKVKQKRVATQKMQPLLERNVLQMVIKENVYVFEESC